jgi:hypothetical protein
MKTILIGDTKSISLLDQTIDEIYSFLELLEDEYPNFKDWYFKKVIPGIGHGRSIILKKYKNEIVGLSILKNTHNEKKICTFRIGDKFQRLGIGSEMLKESCGILETVSPLITVSERRIDEFSSILSKNNFKLEHIYQNYYKDNQKEYSFNGDLAMSSKVNPQFVNSKLNKSDVSL